MHSLKTLFRKFNGRDILKRLKLCLVYNDREVENALSLQYFRLFFLFLAREHSTYKKKKPHDILWEERNWHAYWYVPRICFECFKEIAFLLKGVVWFESEIKLICFPEIPVFIKLIAEILDTTVRIVFL